MLLNTSPSNRYFSLLRIPLDYYAVTRDQTSTQTKGFSPEIFKEDSRTGLCQQLIGEILEHGKLPRDLRKAILF